MSWLLSNNKYFAWFTYILAIIINMLILVGYGHSDYRAPEVSLLFLLHCCAVWCAFCLRLVLQVKWVTISLMIVHVASAGLILLVRSRGLATLVVGVGLIAVTLVAVTRRVLGGVVA